MKSTLGGVDAVKQMEGYPILFVSLAFLIGAYFLTAYLRGTFVILGLLFLTWGIAGIFQASFASLRKATVKFLRPEGFEVTNL